MTAIVTNRGSFGDKLVYQEQPVLTLPMIDELHDRRKKASMKAFIDNKEKLTQGIDYFDVPYSEWNPLLEASKRNLLEIKNRLLGIRKIEHQDGKNSDLKVREADLQDEKTADLKIDETHVQEEEINLEFPFPNPPQPTAPVAAEIPKASAKNTSTKPKHHQQKLPLPDPKKHGGRRGNMYFLTASGYALLVKVFNDPLSWEIQRTLVRSYFGQGSRPRKRLSA